MSTNPTPRAVVLLSQWLLDTHPETYPDWHASRPAAQAAIDFIGEQHLPPVSGGSTPDGDVLAAARRIARQHLDAPIVDAIIDQLAAAGLLTSGSHVPDEPSTPAVCDAAHPEGVATCTRPPHTVPGHEGPAWNGRIVHWTDEPAPAPVVYRAGDTIPPSVDELWTVSLWHWVRRAGDRWERVATDDEIEDGLRLVATTAQLLDDHEELYPTPPTEEC